MPSMTWVVECKIQLEYSSKWSLDAISVPTVDVYVVGRIFGFPIILTQTLKLLPRRKRVCHCTLDVILEGNETEESCLDLSKSESHDRHSSFIESNRGCDCDCDWESKVEVEEHEDLWIDLGLRFGIAFGLGMCFGIGLLVNTYQITSRTLGKRIL